MFEFYVYRAVRNGNVVTCAGFRSPTCWFEVCMRPRDAQALSKQLIAQLRLNYKTILNERAPPDAWLALKNEPDKLPWNH